MQRRRPQSSRLGTQRSQESKSVNRPASVPQKKTTINFFAKEEEYRRLNAELETKTAELVRQAEQVMKEQNEVLATPIFSHLDINIDDEDEFRKINLREPTRKRPSAKSVSEGWDTSKSMPQNRCNLGNCKKTETSKASLVDDVAIVEDFACISFANTIQNLEEKQNNDDGCDNIEDDILPNVGEAMGKDAQIRFLKAKLCVMQEELNRLSHECSSKDDENRSLSGKIKDLEEDRVRLQKTANIQQIQIEKHKALAEESNKNCDGLQQQVTALQKEIESFKRAQKQSASNHSTVEVRLNRALEELERSKTQLNKIKQTSKDNTNQEHQKIESLLIENKKLEKQKAELIVGFKKQLKLIDILKKQKMHFEAAKMLSFTEEEFMKALDWGKS